MKNYDETRRKLKEAGYRRRDRHNEELWIPPNGRYGIKYISAWRRYLREQKEKGK